jgi:hypothetical protein
MIGTSRLHPTTNAMTALRYPVIGLISDTGADTGKAAVIAINERKKAREPFGCGRKFPSSVGRELMPLPYLDTAGTLILFTFHYLKYIGKHWDTCVQE